MLKRKTGQRPHKLLKNIYSKDKKDAQKPTTYMKNLKKVFLKLLNLSKNLTKTIKINDNNKIKAKIILDSIIQNVLTNNNEE